MTAPEDLSLDAAVDAVNARLGPGPTEVRVFAVGGRAASFEQYERATWVILVVGLGATVPALLALFALAAEGSVLWGLPLVAAVVYVVASVWHRRRPTWAHVRYTGDVRAVTWDDHPASLLDPPTTDVPVDAILEALAAARRDSQVTAAPAALRRFLARADGRELPDGGLSLADPAAGHLAVAPDAGALAEATPDAEGDR